jgi:replication factor A2
MTTRTVPTPSNLNYQITFVAQIRQFTKQSTHHQLKLDDGTGVIEAKRYIDIEKMEEDEPDMELDQYVRVYGRLKAFNNKRYIAVHVIRPVTDFNEVNYHLLEATAVHLYSTQGLPGQQGAGAGGDGMFVDGDNKGAAGMAGAAPGAKRINCSPTALKLYNFIKTAAVGNEGVHLQVITSGTGMTAREVMASADELLGLGEIYTTLDDETWAILEY